MKSQLLGIAICISQWACCADSPNPPSGVRVFPTYETFSAQTPTDDKGGSVYQVLPMVRLKEEGLKVIGLNIRRPNFRGIGGSVKSELVLEYGITVIDEKTNHVFLPVDPSQIEEYILLVRKLTGRGGVPADDWRVLIIRSNKLNKNDKLVIPEPKELSTITEWREVTEHVRSIEKLRKHFEWKEKVSGTNGTS